MKKQRVILVGGEYDGHVVEVLTPWRTIPMQPKESRLDKFHPDAATTAVDIVYTHYRRLEVRLHGEKVVIATCCENDLDALARFKKITATKGDRNGSKQET